MTTLTVEFRGICERVIERLIAKGYAKTKAEALRYAVLHTGEGLQLVKEGQLHERAEEYAYEDIKKRIARLFVRDQDVR